MDTLWDISACGSWSCYAKSALSVPAPVPVVAFVAYPYLKRFTWLCHWWLEVVSYLLQLGRVAITGGFPQTHGTLICCISLGVLIWIAAFDLGYAQMDIESDKKNGVKSFPATFTPLLQWLRCWFNASLSRAFSIVSPTGTLISLGFATTVLAAAGNNFQDWWFRAHASTGWILLLQCNFDRVACIAMIQINSKSLLEFNNAFEIPKLDQPGPAPKNWLS